MSKKSENTESTQHTQRHAPKPKHANGLEPIQMMWFGRPLGLLEKLSICSFRRHGHQIHLYTYGEVQGVPSGVVIKDASTIVPRCEFEESMAIGTRPGVFSDYFRAQLLYQLGGWWVDCDVVCLKPFDFASEIVFGWQDQRVLNNAVLRCPAEHELVARLSILARHPSRPMKGDSPRRLARKLRDACLRRNHPAQTSWGATGPAALSTAARGSGVLHYALSPEMFYPISWSQANSLYEPSDLTFRSATFAVHLWNEVRGSREPERNSMILRWAARFCTD